MPSNSAEYMREYRKRQRRETVMNTTEPAQAVRDLIDAQDRIRVLEAEVARLKRELAKQGKLTWDKRGVMHIEIPPDEPERPFAEFRPVPKPAKRK